MIINPIRDSRNPLIQPRDVAPAGNNYTVFGVFNAGATKYRNKVVLLVRVAERPVSEGPDTIKTAYFDPARGKVETKIFQRNDNRIDFSDPRVVFNANKKKVLGLTSLSSLRLAESDDGLIFKVADKPFISSSDQWETRGCEDARITKIGNTYWINYTAVSERGIATALASTKNFKTVTKHGIIFAVPNRDVVIFPEKINGLYGALHRPMPSMIGEDAIWWADSRDLLRWGSHKYVVAPRPGMWDGKKVGGGAPPIKTKKGWLALYHGVDENDAYRMGALLLDLKEPWKVLARSKEPLLEPLEKYEKEGVFPNVCFSCGAIATGDELKIYYGAADKTVCLARASIKEILSDLEN